MMQQASEAKSRSETPIRGAASLRTRLIAANVIITALAVAAMGYFVYFRAQQSNAFLASQLETSIRQQAENNLAAASDEQVATLNAFFAAMRGDITDAGTSAAEMLSEGPGLNSGQYWDATKSMARLASGSWDNPSSSEPASVFMPATTQLTEPLTLELNTLRYLDFVVPGKLQANPDAVAVYFGGLRGETVYYPNIDLASVVPADFDVTQRPWFVKAAPAQNPSHAAVWSDPYADAALHGLVVTTSVPVLDSRGTFRGVIAMDVQLRRITEVVSGIHAGETGYAFLIDRGRRLIAMPESGYTDLGITADALPLGEVMDPSQLASGRAASLTSVLTKMSAGQSGLEAISLGGVDRFVVYRPVSEVGYSMAIIVPSQELLGGAIAARQQLAASSANTTQTSLALVAVILLFAVLATILLGNTLISPLMALTRTAEEITRGNLNAQAPVAGRDEIGMLSQTLNTMTGNLREMVQSLEQRVKDRTAALEGASLDANRRATQFEAITRVTRAISSIRNVDELLPLVTSVISEQFGYYHVGIFLNDENSRKAYLIAANSDGGRRMLERAHSLTIGEQGIVGYVAARGEPRLARSVGEDIIFFNNPDLPLTKSEAALPLRSSERVIGVLDVQSVKVDAFTPDDLRILAVLADQVSLAIENTRLFEMTRRSLSEAETLYRQYVRDAWSGIQRGEQVAGYRYTPRGSAPLRAADRAGLADQERDRDTGSKIAPITVPIKLRGQTIGELVVRGSQDREWDPDQVDLVRAVAERVALSVENARLFDETGRRAERERLVTEIASKIRSTNDPQEMMRTALEELRNALGATQVQIIPQTVPGAPEAEGQALPTVAPDPAGSSRPRNGAKP